MTFKKFLSVFVLTFFAKFGFGQVYQSMPQYGYGPVKRMDIDSTLTIPTVCGVPTLKSNILRKSAIAFDTCNNRFYYYNSKTLIWDTIKGGGGSTSDTASVVKATVHNAENATLTKGTVVYLYGATGNVASVKRAYNTSDTFSSKTFAIVKNDIPQGATGTVITQGVVDKLNLGAYNEGDIVWLDSIPGQFTKNKPSAPYHQVFIGIVERANAGNGQLYVKIQNGYELGELHNVSVNSQADNDVLYYQLSTKLWKAKSPYQLVDTSKLSSRIDLRMKYTDTANLSTRINTKLNTSDSTIYFTRFRSDTMRANIYSQLAQELNVSDTASMLSKYHRLNDSTTYFTRFRSDTMRTNIYNAINGKQNSGTYLTEDPIVLAQQAMGSTIKGVCVACRSFRDMLSQATLATGTIYITAYYLTQSATITGVKYYQQTQGNFTANNENRFGLYTYSGGVLTLVASSANNTNLWKGTAGTVVSEPFSSPYSAAAGLYFIVGIYNASGTPPTNPATGACSAKIGVNVANGDFTNSARFTATGSATTLPSSITMSTTTATTLNLAFFLY